MVDAAQLAVCRHELDGREGVGLEAVLARQPAHAAAEGVARDAHVTRGAGQRGEPGRGGGVGHGAPADSGTHTRTARADVDADLLKVVRPDEQRVLEALDRAGVVSRGLRGDAQAVLGRVAHGLGYVVGARHAHEGCRLLVVGQVEGLARRVPGIVAGQHDLSIDAGLELGVTAALGDQHSVPLSVGCGACIEGKHRMSGARSHRGDPYTYPLTFRGGPLRGGQG